MIHITDKEFRLLSDYIRDFCGINLKEEKKTLLVGRLSNILTEMGIADFSEYYARICKDKSGVEVSKLVDKITTNHTYFMREAQHFQFFTEEVLPFLESNVSTKDLRIWCAASSSGEEPYTLAILLEEYFAERGLMWDKRVLATDLSLNALSKARSGIYPVQSIETMPKTWQLKYFQKISPDSVKVNANIQKEVIFRRFNLLEETFPFKKKFHTIFCRNVMIYFDNDVKEELINKMYDSLEYGGYLFIGHSESLNREKTKFRYIKPAVYRKL